jgi:hypothetical protein
LKNKSFLTALFLLAGCENGQFVFTEQARKQVHEKFINQHEQQRLEFEKCMGLAAKIQRQADDDVSNIINECKYTSDELTSYLEK